jgi:membrane-associated phospholipid phosphatase
MIRILAAALWLAGLAVIAGAGAWLVRRAPRAGPAATSAGRAAPGTLPAAPAAHPAGGGPAGRPGAAAGAGDRDLGRIAMNFARFCLFVIAGAVLVYGVMTAVGVLVIHAGPALDQPVFSWTLTHRMSSWARVMSRLTKIGNPWTTWGACFAAAVCLAVTWRRNRWLPPAAFAAAIVTDHYLTLALRHTFHRIGPPGSPGGTFPSGGVDRCILFYGLIAYLLWREFSGRRRTAIWAGTAVAALAFNEAYSRWYLGLHWTTDVLSGLLYGSLLLLVVIGSVRLVLGPAAGPAGPPAPAVISSPAAAAPAGGPRHD